jgi:hypothetical protein
LFTVYYSLLSITAGLIRIARVTARAAARATANSNTTAGNAIIDISVPFTPYDLKIKTRWGFTTLCYLDNLLAPLRVTNADGIIPACEST